MRPRRGRRIRYAIVAAAVIAFAGVTLYLFRGSPGSKHPSRAASVAARRPPTASSLPPTTAPPATTTSTTQPPRAALTGKTIVIDPGHDGGNGSHPQEISRPVNIITKYLTCDTTGTETDAGYTESAYDFDVATRLAAILRASGATVVPTRTDDSGVGPCIDERAAIGNRARADAAISVHADGGPASGRGFHVIYPALVPGHTDAIVAPSTRLAIDVRDAYQSETGLPEATYVGHDGLNQRNDLGGLNLSLVPKVFIETANMRNATDAALLTDPKFRQRVAQGIANGLTRFLVSG